MGVYTRPNSPYLWIKLPGRGGERFSSGVPKVGATPAQTKEHRQLAEAIYNVRMGDIARGRFDLPSRTPAPAMITFNTQADWYETHVLTQHKGAYQEAWKLRPLRRFFGEMPLDQITPQRWQEYVAQRMQRDGVVLNTIGRELVVAKSVLHSAVGELLDYNPLATVKRKVVSVKAKRTITKKEEPAFLAALQRIDPELADMYLVGVGTLLRQSTLIGLRRGEHHGTFVAVMTKTGRHEVLLTGPTELQRRAARVLKQRMPQTADGYFFPRWQACFARYPDRTRPGFLLRRKVRAAAFAVGLPWGLKKDGIVWHTATRASGATRMLREHNVDIRTIQLLGGWASLDQLAEYLGINLDLQIQQKRA